MTQPPPSLSAPFAVAPHVTDPSGLVAAWWTDPPGVLVQLTGPARGTTEMAEWLIGPAFDQVVRRFPDASDLRVILDMRQMTGRSATARSLLLQRGKTLIGRVTHVVLVPSTLLGPAYIKVVEAAALLLRGAGLRVDVEASLERVIARHGVRAATVGALDPTAELIAEPRSPVRGPTRDLSRR
jgi:hypothetical protein